MEKPEKLNPSLINLVSLKPSSLGFSISIASFKYVDPSPSFCPRIILSDTEIGKRLITSIRRKRLSIELVVFGALSWNFEEPDEARLLDENLIAVEIKEENEVSENPQHF